MQLNQASNISRSKREVKVRFHKKISKAKIIVDADIVNFYKNDFLWEILWKHYTE